MSCIHYSCGCDPFFFFFVYSKTKVVVNLIPSNGKVSFPLIRQNFSSASPSSSLLVILVCSPGAWCAHSKLSATEPWSSTSHCSKLLRSVALVQVTWAVMFQKCEYTQRKVKWATSGLLEGKKNNSLEFLFFLSIILKLILLRDPGLSDPFKFE